MGKKRRTRKRQSSMALRRNGLSAFEQRAYSKAIEAWERVRRQTPDMLPASALAEAYFRRGLHRLYEARASQAGLDDLKQAVDLEPDDTRTIYHLGLAAHYQGRLDDAIRHYRTVHQSASDYARRAAYPLALALLQQGKDPAQTSVWDSLDDEERAMLQEVSAFRRRPYTVSDHAPLLWQAIAALDDGNEKQATASLQQALERAASPVERQLTHYYRGVLAARNEDWEEALRAWNASRAAGLKMERLEENLQEGYHRLAEARLERGDVEGALLAGEEALRYGSIYPSLEGLVSHAHQRLAHQAVSDGRWADAHKHWEAADAAEEGSFRLAYNLALAHEHSEDFLSAGERWREALRRRPRSDDHPDALTDDQVARLWQRAAEAYTKAGEFNEAVQVYRNAVKWNPERLEARLALSEALLLNGQSEAAENELQRILDHDPDNIPALLRMGEVIQTSWHRWMGSPVAYWERVLELDPGNAVARQLLVEFYQDEAEHALRWGDHERALQMYEEALSAWPGNARVSAAIGALYVRLDEYESAQSHIERALRNASDDLTVYEQIIRAWLDVYDLDEAWHVMEETEARLDSIPYEFYIAQASYCIDYAEDAVPMWLDRAVEQAPPDTPVLERIGEMAAMNGALDLAREYLERAIEADQEPGQAHLLLGLVALQQGDTAKAEMRWNDALKIARRTDDEKLMEQVERTRFMFHAPPELLDLIERYGPQALMAGLLPDFVYDELDEWW